MTPDDTQRRNLRQAPEALDAVLDKLDLRSERYGQVDAEQVARRYPRTRYRLLIDAEIQQPSDTVLYYAVATRNISLSGLGFLIGQFVYPGSSCRLHLTGSNNYSQAVTGRIMRCSYVWGTGSLHEVGVRFDEAIDLTRFQESGDVQNRTRILIVDNDATMRNLYRARLKEYQVDIDFVNSSSDAIQAVRKSCHDLILIDLDMPEIDGVVITRELRDKGFLQPIIALAVDANEQTQKELSDAGCTSFVTKPITRDFLAQLMNGIVPEPLISKLARDPDMVASIDSFVGSLPEHIQNLETAFEADDLQTLEQTIRLLKGQGASFGFEAISATATELQNLLQARIELNTIRDNLSELVKLCRAARPATDQDNPPAT
ncbi:MAG: response regulator [Planctomycetota bacterium]